MWQFNQFLMLRRIAILFSLAVTLSNLAQIKPKTLTSDGGALTNGRMQNDTLTNPYQEEVSIELDGKTHYTDYKVISYAKDTTVVDTTLSLKKERLFNYIRKNNFELLPLHNLGQTFNRLGYDFNQTGIFPEMGERAKYFNYFQSEDINYYKVPTPTTELFFQTGIQQGQMLSSLITMNLNPQLNISLNYKGLRSLGEYKSSSVFDQNFITTLSYASKKHKYIARGYYAGQNILNQENGGLTDAALLLYTTDDPEYKDRVRLETNFNDADNRLKTRTYYLEQGYNLWYHAPDSTHQKESYWQIGHEMNYNRKFYTFDQTKANAYFGSAYQNTIADSTYYIKMEQGAFTELKSPWILGKLRFKLNYNTLNYGYNSVLFLPNQFIPATIKGHNTTAQANWQAGFKSFQLDATAGSVFEGVFKGNFLTGTATFSLDSLFTVKATALLQSQAPNLNMTLYQSGYVAYNWYHQFENEQTRFLGFELLSDKWFDAAINLTNKDFYTYFDPNSQPVQYNTGLVYTKLKLHKEFRYRKFALDHTVQYQKVLQGSEVLHVPELITENTLYFSSDVFKRKPMYLQTGVTFKYFNAYYADEFNPLLNEFRLQNEVKIGNYPLLEFFANARVQRTRLFLKLENMGALLQKGTYFATPTQPYRDFKVRFGLIWNFFI